MCPMCREMCYEFTIWKLFFISWNFGQCCVVQLKKNAIFGTLIHIARIPDIHLPICAPAYTHDVPTQLLLELCVCVYILDDRVNFVFGWSCANYFFSFCCFVVLFFSLSIVLLPSPSSVMNFSCRSAYRFTVPKSNWAFIHRKIIVITIKIG